MDVMYDMPSETKKEVVITPEFALEKIEKVNSVRLQVG